MRSRRRLWRGICRAAAYMMGAILLSSAPIWAQDETMIARGERAYTVKRCAVCHVINGQGGKSGPDLSHVGSQRDTEWLAAFLKAPKAMIPKGRMPAFQGSEEELKVVVAYMASLR